MGEQGGLNLYGFVLNNPIGSWDYLGMAVGHHYVPKQVFKNMGFPKDVVKFFNKQTTGKIPGGHGWSKAHKQYNAAVQKLVNQYIKKNGITPCLMDLGEAQDLLKKVKKSKGKAIKSFLFGIKEAQKAGSKMFLLGAGVSSVDAAIRNDPIETLHLISIGDL